MRSPHHPHLTLNPTDKGPEQGRAARLILCPGHVCWTLCWQERPGVTLGDCLPEDDLLLPCGLLFGSERW